MAVTWAIVEAGPPSDPDPGVAWARAGRDLVGGPWNLQPPRLTNPLAWLSSPRFMRLLRAELKIWGWGVCHELYTVLHAV